MISALRIPWCPQIYASMVQKGLALSVLHNSVSASGAMGLIVGQGPNVTLMSAAPCSNRFFIHNFLQKVSVAHDKK